jgi:small subunit ribosomal protein S16
MPAASRISTAATGPPADADCFEDYAVAVRIRMKMMGRKHRQFFRIVAIDGRQPRDGRIIEELGTYDPQVKDTDARTTLKPDRIKYWMGVGAKPSEKVAVLFKKYMGKWEAKQAEAAVAAQAPAEPTAAG